MVKDYKAIGETAQLISHWHASLVGARQTKSQAESDITVAERNLSAYERKLTELLKEAE